jgi:hypothetical protein
MIRQSRPQLAAEAIILLSKSLPNNDAIASLFGNGKMSCAISLSRLMGFEASLDRV